MDDAPWQLLEIGGVEPIAVAGVNWRPLRQALGVEAFGINAYTGAVGEHVVEPHTEEGLGHEEIYLVLAGRATFTLDGTELDVLAGSLVFVRDATVHREAVAAVDGTTVLAIGGKAGEAYRPSGWEASFLAERHRSAGDHAAAIAGLEEALERSPDEPSILYALACWHALAGHEDEAVDHGRRAIALEPDYAESAANDADLAGVRDRLL